MYINSNWNHRDLLNEIYVMRKMIQPKKIKLKEIKNSKRDNLFSENAFIFFWLKKIREKKLYTIKELYMQLSRADDSC